jgi:hypothetical protein
MKASSHTFCELSENHWWNLAFDSSLCSQSEGRYRKRYNVFQRPPLKTPLKRVTQLESAGVLFDFWQIKRLTSALTLAAFMVSELGNEV